MSNISLIKSSCLDQTVDAVVNAANRYLGNGSGVCGAIFKKAGVDELSAACSAYPTPIEDGFAVITPAFKMENAKYIIHAVGPDFARTPRAFTELQDAYYHSLCLLMSHDLHSISFPLISSGIFGGRLNNPVAVSTRQCCRAYRRFISNYPDYEIDVRLCAFSVDEYFAAEHDFELVLNQPSNAEMISELSALCETGSADESAFHQAFFRLGIIVYDYVDYLTALPADFHAELNALDSADYDTCCAILTLLNREERFRPGSFIEHLRAGEVTPIIERMICFLEMEI